MRTAAMTMISGSEGVVDFLSFNMRNANAQPQANEVKTRRAPARPRMSR